MTVTHTLRVALLGALLATLAAAPASATDAPETLGVDENVLIGTPSGPPLSGAALETATEETAGLLRCPTCQGLSVADSPADSAQAMKKEVKDLLAAGYTSQQVLDYFQKAYGEFIWLAPKKEGFNLLVWFAPFCALALGLALVLWRVGEAGKEKERRAAERERLEPYLARVRREVGA